MKRFFTIMQTIGKLALASGSIALFTSSAIANPIQSNNYNFNLQGCKHKGKWINCEFLITNLETQDRLLKLTDSRIIDTSGNEYRVGIKRLGKSESYQTWATNTLIPRVPMKASMSFENVSRSVTKIAILELKTYPEKAGVKEQTIQFRNINIGG